MLPLLLILISFVLIITFSQYPLRVYVSAKFLLWIRVSNV